MIGFEGVAGVAVCRWASALISLSGMLPGINQSGALSFKKSTSRKLPREPDATGRFQPARRGYRHDAPAPKSQDAHAQARREGIDGMQPHKRTAQKPCPRGLRGSRTSRVVKLSARAKVEVALGLTSSSWSRIVVSYFPHLVVRADLLCHNLFKARIPRPQDFP